MCSVLKDKKSYLLFLLPGLLFYLFSVFYPIVESIRLSFMKWNGISDATFVGLANYVKMFNDRIFWKAFGHNLVYLVIVVGMQILIGLFFAILLTYLTRGVHLIKTLYYVPAIITTVAVAQLFRAMYASQPEGIFNKALKLIGLGSLATSWLTNVHTALAAVSIPEGWRYTGLYMVIFYSALISLDPEISEAAKVDGANEWQLLWRIKLPMIRPIFLLTFTMVVTGALRGFDIPYTLTNGGPGNVTELLSTYMYKKAFGSNQFGYGSAISVFIVVESLISVGILQRIFRTDDDRPRRSLLRRKSS